jgi:RNA recognition motif-containing protein
VVFAQIFVGNLSWGVDDEALFDMFGNFESVVEARVILDMETGRSKGFGFVSFGALSDAEEAINQMNGQVSQALWAEIRVSHIIVLEYDIYSDTKYIIV